MNYFLDQEFHEYFKKPISWLPTIGSFNKPYHTIELISIGIVSEDGREYYAVCNEFDLRAAKNNKWLFENVLRPIIRDLYLKHYVAGEGINGRWDLNKSQFWMIKNFGKTKKEIMYEINDFICSLETASEYAGFGSLDHGFANYLEENPPVFYGYFADYDWVLFCSIYGTMMYLPDGFPMYCNDLKQTLDEYNRDIFHPDSIRFLKGSEFTPTLEECLEKIKEFKDYPKQINEHHALADAKWNFELYKFLHLVGKKDV